MKKNKRKSQINKKSKRMRKKMEKKRAKAKRKSRKKPKKNMSRKYLLHLPKNCLTNRIYKLKNRKK
jgi:hypothetical protein